MGASGFKHLSNNRGRLTAELDLPDEDSSNDYNHHSDDGENTDSDDSGDDDGETAVGTRTRSRRIKDDDNDDTHISASASAIASASASASASFNCILTFAGSDAIIPLTATCRELRDTCMPMVWELCLKDQFPLSRTSLPFVSAMNGYDICKLYTGHRRHFLYQQLAEKFIEDKKVARGSWIYPSLPPPKLTTVADWNFCADLTLQGM
jgi:hypothetical protein